MSAVENNMESQARNFFNKKPEEEKNIANELIGKLTSPPPSGERKIVSDAETSKAFSNIEEMKLEGTEFITDKVRITDESERERIAMELGADQDTLVILPIFVTGDKELVKMESKDVGHRHKKHLDYLSSKHNVRVIPMGLTGFTNSIVEPTGFMKLDIEGSLFYHREDMEIDASQVTSTVDVLRAQMEVDGFANISLLTPFETEKGSMQTLFLTMPEIRVIAEKFAMYQPVIICDRDDIKLTLNALISDTTTERVE